jgi:hypothetical protein
MARSARRPTTPTYCEIPILEDQVGVGKLAVRIFIQELHVRMRWRAIQVEVAFLDVFAVIPLRVGQAEQPFLQNGIASVPQRHREAEKLTMVGDAGNPVFAPSIRARSRLIVREVVPGIAVGTIVFANRAPLPLAQVRSPFFPRHVVRACLPQSGLFSVVQYLHSRTVAPGQRVEPRRNGELNGAGWCVTQHIVSCGAEPPG